MPSTFKAPAALLLTLTLGLAGGLGAKISRAESIDELKQQIQERNQKISLLEAEIERLEKEIVETHGQRETLQGKLRELEATRKKLAVEISATQTKIESATLTIEGLAIEIVNARGKIENQTAGLAHSLRQLDRDSGTTLIEIFLSGRTMGEALSDIELNEKLQQAVKKNLTSLRETKNLLEVKKETLEESRRNLVALQNTLADKKSIALSSQRQTAALLETSKNREAEYRKILARQIALKEQFEKELRDFESQLRVAIDPESLPEPGKGILSWPVKSTLITQQFGDTAFSRSHPLVYNGNGHNGIDLGASLGSSVQAAEAGVAAGTGDTDLGCPGGSYGRWVLIKHHNGLSTLYAHLSLIKVSPGQSVSRGELVGYSGSSGYSTGPHLHFTVYASQAVRIGEITKRDGSKSKCGLMPLSPLNGYLNPLLYL